METRWHQKIIRSEKQRAEALRDVTVREKQFGVLETVMASYNGALTIAIPAYM